MSNNSTTTGGNQQSKQRTYNDKRPDDPACPFPFVEGLRRLFSKKQDKWYYGDGETGSWVAPCADGVPAGYESAEVVPSTAKTAKPLVGNFNKPSSPSSTDSKKRPWHETRNDNNTLLETLNLTMKSIELNQSKLCHELSVLNTKLAELNNTCNRLCGKINNQENEAMTKLYLTSVKQLNHSVENLAYKLTNPPPVWTSVSKPHKNNKIPKTTRDVVTMVLDDDDDKSDHRDSE
jgi:hypothetical protein